MKRIGRPPRYKKEFDDQAYKLSLLGYTDVELGVFFEVAESTINNWKKAHPSFLESIKKGKEIADTEVSSRLFDRAKGVRINSTKFFQHEGIIQSVPYVEEYPPDTTAAIFWLKNRQPKKWRDKQEVDQNITVHMPDIEIAPYDSAARKKTD